MRAHVIRIVAGAVLMLVPVPVAAQSEVVPGLTQWIEQAMDDWDVPGLALAVVREDSVIFAGGFGVREVGRQEPVDERTIFAIGSASKAFTATAMGVLVDEGEVEWDDRVIEHLPGFRLYDPYATREMTLRDLLTHRSGLSRGDLAWLGGAFDRDEVLRRVRHLEPSWSFRSRFGYQNIMYLAAGEVIEEVTGKTWDAFVTERFLVPLGMTESSTSVNALPGKSNVATPHAEIEDSVRTVAWRNIDNIAPAGSINSNVIEMSEWVRMWLDTGESGDEAASPDEDGSGEGRAILSDTVAREAFTPQMLIRKEGYWALIAPGAHFIAYGLGWFLNDYKGHRIVQHGGNIDGNSALVAFIPEASVGLVVLTNMNGTALPTAVMYHVFDAMLGVDTDRDWSERLLEGTRELEESAEEQRQQQDSARVAETVPSLPLEAYVGTYVDSLHGELDVSLEGDHLVIRNQTAFTGDLSHWHYDTFRVTWRDLILGTGLVTFTLDQRGRPAAVQLPQAEFRRTPEPEQQETGSRQ